MLTKMIQIYPSMLGPAFLLAQTLVVLVFEYFIGLVFLWLASIRDGLF